MVSPVIKRLIVFLRDGFHQLRNGALRWRVEYGATKRPQDVGSFFKPTHLPQQFNLDQWVIGHARADAEQSLQVVPLV